jgi:NADH pyrophosphatase NudC (nudix superfamily)
LAPGGGGVAVVVAPRAVATRSDGAAVWLAAADVAIANLTVANDAVNNTWPLIWLGRRRSDAAPCFGLALDDSPAAAALLTALDATLTPLRAAMATLSPADLSVAGAASALAAWHASTPFCSTCGAPTAPSCLATRRACAANHRFYPRVDPVAIALVASPDNAAALLVRPRSRGAQLPFLTCVSGFVEAGEPVEAAVVREVAEETGVTVAPDSVRLVQSQAWPPGRAGGCELMLGAAARAVTTSLAAVNRAELDECVWMPRDAVAAALAGAGDAKFRAPPAGALATELMRAWVAGDGVWSRL